MGLNIRHITDDFVNHVLYGDYLLDDRAIFKGEEMDETLVFSYVREMTRYYESENVPDEVKRRVLRSDFFVIWHNYRISSDRDKYFLALGLKKLVCSAGDYGVLVSDYDLKKMMDIEITGEGCLHDIILDYYKKNELLSGTGDNTSGDNSETGGDEVGEDEGYRISLPLAMDTESARDIFTAAFNEGWMVGDNTTGYTWKGFGNISKSTGKTVSCSNKLAYLCYKIYESSPPWSEIGKFFNIERLDRDWSNIAYNINNPNRQTWMNTIDNLIRKTLC